MKLQYLSVIFVIIVIPVILVASYYISLQVDTINLQTAYDSKLLDATKEAIESFEINTVEWNSNYNNTGDVKRANVLASINTFKTSFANSLGMGGASSEEILSYVPAIAFTLYDGYYIYSPAKTKKAITDENGVQVLMTEKLNCTGYTYENEDEGKLLYECNEGDRIGTYKGKNFTFDETKAIENGYSHILKPLTSYSATYCSNTNNTKVTINYTLDNYISVYGTIDGEQINKSGYLINDIEEVGPEHLKETVWYEGLDKPREYPYIYDYNRTKVYKYDDGTLFQISANNKRTNIINGGMFNGDYKKIIDGNGYTKQVELADNDDMKDYSAMLYYKESAEFTEWVKENLTNIKIGDMVGYKEDIYGDGSRKIFDISDANNPDNEDSIFSEHKREVIKQSLISNLNQAITSYSRNSSDADYKLPVLSETDWDKILRNVSITTFVQNIPIGMKYYNNYAIATSTENREYVYPSGIYLNVNEEGNNSYHLPGCEKLTSDNIIGYRNVDYVLKEYTKKDADGNKETKYYYPHQSISQTECYYCIIDRNTYNTYEESSINLEEQNKAYSIALARERYNNITTNMETSEPTSETTNDEPIEEPSNWITITLYNNYSNEDNSFRTIKFNPDDESTYTTITKIFGTDTTITKIFGTERKLNKMLGIPTRTGYTFQGWNDRRDGMGSNSYSSSYPIKNFTDNIELYAQWKKDLYTVEFIVNGETFTIKDDYEYRRFCRIS